MLFSGQLGTSLSPTAVVVFMSSDKIAVIGDRDTVTGFRLVGVSECAVPKTPEETRDLLYQFFRDPSMGLIMITEPLAAEVEDTIVELSLSPVPVILLVPDRDGTTGAYEAVLKELIRRAVGIEINI
jgi:V/A-type H+-transporting ATPase subunit F